MTKYRDLARLVNRQKEGEKGERRLTAEEEKAQLRSSQLRFNKIAKSYAQSKFKVIAEDINSQGVDCKFGFVDNRSKNSQSDDSDSEQEVEKLHFHAEVLGHKLSVYWSDYNKSVVFSSYLFPIRDRRAKHNTRDLMVTIDELDEEVFDTHVGRFLDLVFEKELKG